MNAKDIKSQITRAIPYGKTYGEKKRGAILGHLVKLCGGNDGRRSFLNYVFGVSSAKELTDTEYERIRRWLKPTCIDDVWMVDPNCELQAAEILREYLIEKGQQELPL